MKKINKQTVSVVFLVASLVVNGYLVYNLYLDRQVDRLQGALDMGYIEGFKAGGLEGFKVGLETGRACITDGVAGVCEGTASVGGEMWGQ